MSLTTEIVLCAVVFVLVYTGLRYFFHEPVDRVTDADRERCQCHICCMAPQAGRGR